ncbi:MAG: acetate--CoA ligase family protein [Proteobacteria bacterium]|nr:acetate--CoA ligase family protein [Pseudomonadota bacterium]
MLSKLFTPRSVAVVGASREEGKVGHSIMKNLVGHGFAGPIYPVNPKAKDVMGHPCFKDLRDVPDGCDLAVIAVPARLVPGIVEECGRKGIGAAIVISAGFKEVGGEGADLEKRLFNAAMTSGVRVLGPNCLGLINTRHRLDVSFAASHPEEGDIAVISQSGALCTAIIDWSVRNHIGFSKLISIGNKVDIDEEVLIEELGEDDDTKVIVGYLENIVNGPHFMRSAERVTKRKPIILIKAGNTAAGAAAASSHTGSLAGARMAYECAFRTSGILQASSLESLFDYAQAFSYQPLPRGRRVAVVTNAGGPGIMAADAVENSGLAFAKLGDETTKALSSFLPAAANIHNPVDILGDALAETYGRALEALLADDGVDAAVVLLTPQAMTDAAEAARVVAGVSGRHGKPVVASFIGADRVSLGIEILQRSRVPHYPTPERAVEALQVMAEFAKWKERPPRVIQRFSVNTTKVDRVLNLCRKRGQFNVGEQDSKAILAAYGFTVPKASLARSADEAASASAAIGFPVVMKIVSPDIIHKSDVGGVKVGLAGSSEVRDAYDLMIARIRLREPRARLQGVLVQEMVGGGREIIVGMTRDPQFGPMLMFGLGGVYVEVLRDVSFQLAPITRDEAFEMLIGTKTYKLLKGVRGEKSVDMELVAECIRRISQLSMDFPAIEELDINPLNVSSDRAGAVAVDARIKIRDSGPGIRNSKLQGCDHGSE